MPDERIGTYAKGVMGESAACSYLMEKGMQLLQRRYRSPYGEIDLVMLDGEILVFAEVKTRERQGRLQAQYAVTPVKQRRLIQTGRCYLGEHPEHQERLIRFDVITVAGDGVLHLPNAFEGAIW